ncbi:MAG TPA: anti-sigma factor [Capillimicrobium sp.]
MTDSSPFLHHRDDDLATAAAWVLGALPEPEAEAYASHLAGCAECRDEVARLQPVADALPLAAPDAEPSPNLKLRIMAEVEREASLLAAAGPEADRPPAPRRERQAPRWWRWLIARPALVAAGLAVGLVLGVGAGMLASGGEEDPGALSASVTALGPGGGTHGELLQSGRHAEIRVDGVPSPPPGRVYQVWIVRDGKPAPDAVFTVDRDGDGSVVLEGDLSGAEQVLITNEPEGGSRRPTSDPTLGATPA